MEKIQQSGFYQKYLLSGKIFAIGFIALLMMIPAVLVKDLMQERQERSSEAKQAIHEMWSGRQTLIGPIIEVPYTEDAKPYNQMIRSSVFYVMPDELNIKATLHPEKRRLGMFETVLYRADIDLKGSFDLKGLIPVGVDEKSIRWDEVKLIVSVDDARGIKEASLVDGESNVGLEAYTRRLQCSGLNKPLFCALPMNASGKRDFSVNMKLKGSEHVGFVPVGGKTVVSVDSSWHSPGFMGEFLPDTRDIGDEGFSAQWTVTGISHGLPKMIEHDSINFRNSELGVNLMMPVGVYSQSLRLVSYSLLFVFFIFGAVFCAERVSGVSVHVLQYLIAGVAIMIFYVLLLSLAEHMAFAVAYAIAAAVILAMVLGYFNAILGSKNLTLSLGGMLALMYSFFYVVLQAEDYALLMGSIGLVAIVGAVMYLTRDIHKVEPTGQPVPQP